jgi:hypothetical protein
MSLIAIAGPSPSARLMRRTTGGYQSISRNHLGLLFWVSTGTLTMYCSLLERLMRKHMYSRHSSRVLMQSKRDRAHCGGRLTNEDPSLLSGAIVFPLERSAGSLAVPMVDGFTMSLSPHLVTFSHMSVTTPLSASYTPLDLDHHPLLISRCDALPFHTTLSPLHPSLLS